MRVLVGPDTDDLDELYAVPPDRRGGSWLRVNMVGSVDGAATGDSGKSGSLNNDVDKRVFHHLRSAADVIVVGAGTARTEGYGPGDRPIAVVSRSLDVPERLVVPGQVVITTTDAPADHSDPTAPATGATTATTPVTPITATIARPRRRAVVAIIIDTTTPTTTGGEDTTRCYTPTIGIPVPVEAAERAICTDDIVDVTVTPHGQVLTLGRTRRLFTDAQRLALAIQWGGCAITDCNKPAEFTEAHHIKQWKRDHGTSDTSNGITLCRFHHMMIHDAHWDIHHTGCQYWLIPPRTLDPTQTPIPLHSKNPAIRAKQHHATTEHAHDRDRDAERDRDADRGGGGDREPTHDSDHDPGRNRRPEKPATG